MQTPKKHVELEAKSLSQILSGSRLTSIIQKAKQLISLNEVVHALLEPELRAHCQVANFKQDTLILHASEGLWATRIRFCLPQLLSALQAQPSLEQLKKIICKVRPLD